MITDDYPGSAIERRYRLLKPIFDERLRRLWAAAEALALGDHGVSILAGATGLSRTTIRAGVEEIQRSDADLVALSREGRVRRRGAGRKTVLERDETLESDLATLLRDAPGDGGDPLDWTCKSVRVLAEELTTAGHRVSYRTIGNQLHRMGYRFSPVECYRKFSLEARQGQFRLISLASALFLARSEPVISLGLANQVNHQLVVPEPETAGLASSVLRYWWQSSGVRRFPRARRLLLLMDTAGLPAGERAMWAPLLQPLADEADLEIVAAHFPPGARRWRRSTRELSFSCSGSEDGPALTVELDRVEPSDGELRSESSSAPGPGEPFHELWNYRLEPGRSSSVRRFNASSKV